MHETPEDKEITIPKEPKGTNPKSQEAELAELKAVLLAEMKLVTNPVARALFVVSGTLSLILGVVGIVLPGLPTTPFLLLSAGCYARGSERFYIWLMTNKVFGKYIRNYREGKGIPKKVKSGALTFLWLTILSTVVYVLPVRLGLEDIFLFGSQFSLLLVASLVSWHILSLPTLVTEEEPSRFQDEVQAEENKRT